MRSLIRKFLLACAASAALVFAFAGGVFVFENFGGPADCVDGDCSPRPASATEPADAAPAPLREPEAAPAARIVGVEREISAVAPRRVAAIPIRRVPAGDAEPQATSAPPLDLPPTPPVIEYVLGMGENFEEADDTALPDGGADPDSGLPADLVRGVDALFANEAADEDEEIAFPGDDVDIFPDDDADGDAGRQAGEPGGPTQLIARPLRAATESATGGGGNVSAPRPPPIPAGRPMRLLPGG